MLKRYRGIASAVVACGLLSACAMAMSPVMGSLYTDVKGPLSATSSQANTKEGKSCANGILGAIATGDASIEAARAAGGITQISSVSYHTTNILGLYATFCTIVRGT